MRYSPLDSVRLIPGIGPKVAEGLERMSITSFADLVSWYPRRYLDATQLTSIRDAYTGLPVCIKAEILSTDQRRTKGRGVRMVEARISDGTGELVVRWFNQPYLLNKFVLGSEWIFIGIPRRFKGETVMMSPLVETLPRIIPIYAQTKGITSKMISAYVNTALPNIDLEGRDLPEVVRSNEGLVSVGEALRSIHQPEDNLALEAAKNYLAFEEAFAFFVSMVKLKQGTQGEKGISLTVNLTWFKKIVDSLPFELTAGQKRVVWDALQEMETGKPMTRLLNGDVGSGKTVVAALLAAVVAKNGYRTVVLVPTEILAKQHYESIRKLLPGFSVALWTAAQKDELESADIVIGTHAVLQTSFALDKVGLVVVDEQHRFGVKQRAILREGKTITPHLLSMTATPIPRTLALVLFADLTVSFLKEKPKNRLPIITEIAYGSTLGRVHDRIMQELKAKHQVFVICPLIEEKEKSVESVEAGPTLFDAAEQQAQEKKTVLKEVERLRAEHPEYGRIEAIHGKMKAAEKRTIMEDMAKGEINVLVATSVIEVGVDVPNATVMVVEGAEHFGLAQLHQFRGRVGRHTDQAYCFLCPGIRGELIMQRLQVLVESDSGFAIAEADLALRGPGDITGFAQSGLPDFRMASLTDIEFLQHVKGVVEQYVAEHPDFLKTYSTDLYSQKTATLE